MCLPARERSHDAIRWSRVSSRIGLSPPTRGSRGKVAKGIDDGWSIPAHAGKPPRACHRTAPTAVYPRPRGEASLRACLGDFDHGLSPPTRGSRAKLVNRHVGNGSIPAHAGKPPIDRVSPASIRVYPRPRGEAMVMTWMARAIQGLSPPTRGSRAEAGDRRTVNRSIPAHAGKPRPACRGPWPLPVYPRPRGEAVHEPGDAALIRGLSPPTRGSRHQAVARPPLDRSIPAHAGKPRHGHGHRQRREVYPRPRGEAANSALLSARWAGLSPPTRGSPLVGDVEVGLRGSIPAHAGKPSARRSPAFATQVYPRPRGEAAMRIRVTGTKQGLSPPTRGSHDQVGRDPAPARSIPAHAGKPCRTGPAPPDPAVYPRPRGEACSRCSGSTRTPWVYPRPRGEAELGDASPLVREGLSPPTRGSHRPSLDRHRCPGSIPAHAGKPPPGPAGPAAPRVYPRPRGEAADAGRDGLQDVGLSPPTRGSPALSDWGADRRRSIPAHAGKPCPRR